MKTKREKIETFSLPDLSTLTLKQCFILIVITTVSFLSLKIKGLPYIVIACFFTIPMILGLLVLNKDAAKKLIRFPKGRDLLYGFGFVLPSLILSITSTALLNNLGIIQLPKSNIIIDQLVNDLLFTLIGTSIQLFGEEMLTLIIFLFVMKLWEYFFSFTKGGIIAGFFLSSLVFGAVHYPTYSSWAHVLLSISLGRLLDNFVFLRTKNLTASYLSHLIFDFILFGISIFSTLPS